MFTSQICRYQQFFNFYQQLWLSRVRLRHTLAVAGLHFLPDQAQQKVFTLEWKVYRTTKFSILWTIKPFRCDFETLLWRLFYRWLFHYFETGFTRNRLALSDLPYMFWPVWEEWGEHQLQFWLQGYDQLFESHVDSIGQHILGLNIRRNTF